MVNYWDACADNNKDPGKQPAIEHTLHEKSVMRQQLIVTTGFVVFLLLTVVIKILYFPELHGQSAFYFLSVFWICGILIAILGLNLIWRSFISSQKPSGASTNTQWANRRTTFRIIYPAFLRPTLVVEEIDGLSQRHLEFPIVDLSQGGSSFLDDGSLGTMEHFSGHIRFNSGDCARVAGTLHLSVNRFESKKLHLLLYDIFCSKE
jgi:hypothetical protein